MLLNDDAPPAELAIAVITASGKEGDAGNRGFTFEVTRSVNTSGPLTVNWAVSGADAADFAGGVRPSGTVSFADSETSKTVTVNVKGDTQIEPDETFRVRLQTPTENATITDGEAIATILNDDFPPAEAVPDLIEATGFRPVFSFDLAANDTGFAELVELSALTTGRSVKTEGGRAIAAEDGTLTYVPRRGFTGEDSFSYRIEGLDGTEDTAEVIVAVAPSDPELGAARLVAYLFEAGLGRKAAPGGLTNWTEKLLDEVQTEESLARAFLISDEFADQVGGPVESLEDRALVEELFLNVLDRPGAAGGIEFWLDELSRPEISRPDMLVSFAESPENMLGSPEVATIEQLPDGSFDFV